MAKVVFTKEDKISIVKTPLILFLICLVAVALLAAMNKITEGPIAQNEEKAAMNAMQTVLPACDYLPLTVDETQDDCTVTRASAALDENHSLLGYCVSLEKTGYKDTISVMVAISPDASTVLGVDIISQNETPGLGSKITKDEFLSQFFGVNIPVESNVDTISGATVSSSTVVSIVDTAVVCVQNNCSAWEKEVAR